MAWSQRSLAPDEPTDQTGEFGFAPRQNQTSLPGWEPAPANTLRNLTDAPLPAL